jgi:hypothetical protein
MWEISRNRLKTAMNHLQRTLPRKTHQANQPAIPPICAKKGATMLSFSNWKKAGELGVGPELGWLPIASFARPCFPYFPRYRVENFVDPLLKAAAVAHTNKRIDLIAPFRVEVSKQLTSYPDTTDQLIGSILAMQASCCLQGKALTRAAVSPRVIEVFCNSGSFAQRSYFFNGAAPARVRLNLS